MASRLNTTNVRIAPEFEKKLKEIAKTRLDKGLANFNRQELSPAEMTRLLLKAPSWKDVELQLKNLPKRRI